MHTLPGWRRAGLSRTAFAAAMEHPEALRCSCFALNTGTRNNARALYAAFGYVDMDRRERATKQLHTGTPCVPPDGVALRPIADGDRDAVRRLVHDAHANSFTISPLPVPQLGPRSYTAVAERDGKLVGAALAKYESGDAAELQDVVVAEGEEGAPQIALALLARVHAMLAEAGAQRATAHVCSDLGLFTGALAQAGYAREASGGVNMFGIRDLRQFFEEIRPLYERRLRHTAYTDWQGRVLITGNRLAASLECDRGVVSVIGRSTPRGSDIVLRSTDAVITRLVTGRETPLEGYLQQLTHIEPQTSPGVMGLLETLFPQVPFALRWGWG